MYSSETIIWKDKDRFRLRAAQMDNFKGLLSIRRMDKAPNTGKRCLAEWCNGLKKGFMRMFSDG